MKIYFVEGVDGVGKTTLVKKLSAYSDVKSYTSPPHDWDFTSSINIWKKFLGRVASEASYNESSIILIDRSPITEFVYRMVIDIRKPDMTMSQFAELMSEYNVGILYCRADDAFESAQKRGEDYVLDKSAHDAIDDMYDKFMWTMTMFSIEVHELWPKMHKVVEIYDKLKEVNNAV